jgi:DNA modification methylase
MPQKKIKANTKLVSKRKVTTVQENNSHKAPNTGNVRASETSPTIKTVHPKNPLNNLTSTEWMPETVSVWHQKGLGAKHKDAEIERQHPAPFSFTDIIRLIKFFTKENGVVLDPFAGVGSTLKACAIEKRQGIGIELEKKYVNLTKERLLSEVEDGSGQKIVCGDSRKLIKKLEENSLDFVVTSPPYWNILHKVDHKVAQERVAKNLDIKYSNNKQDLGNIADYDVFLKELTQILGGCGKALKPKKYMAVIVSDFRDKSKYVMFHADLARHLEPYHLEMRGLTVLYQRHKRIFPYGYPYAYVPNIHNQYILILQNNKPK